MIGCNLVILWIVEIGESKVIGRYSKVRIAYCSFEDLYFGKIEIFPKV